MIKCELSFKYEVPLTSLLSVLFEEIIKTSNIKNNSVPLNT